jgi:hypothetical protein
MMAGVPSTDPIFQSKRKATSAIFPYAARLAQNGQRGMIEAILHVASKSPSGGFMWRRIERYITSWFDVSSPPSLDQAITVASTSVDWIDGSYAQGAVARWAAAAFGAPYSEGVGQAVVDALLHIAYRTTLRPYIPIEIWAWLKIRPTLPHVCRGRYLGSAPAVVRHVRGLGDIEILKSYFLLVWSEWNPPYAFHFESGLAEMEIVIREKLCGIAMRRHREDLVERLDHVLGQLDRGLEYFKQHNPRIGEEQIARAREQYGELKGVLMEVDSEASSRTPLG